MARGLASDNFSNVKILAIDLDGVVYQGNNILSGADEAISTLRKYGFKIFFTTNNSGKTRDEIVDKLVKIGIPTSLNEVINSAYVAGYLVKDLMINGSVLIIGMEGLRKEISYTGVHIVMKPPCDFLVVGLDTNFSYEKIQLAMEAISSGATFIACNQDASFPGDHGLVFPGCGPLVSAIERASGIPPKYIAGKPSVLMLQIIGERCHAKPDEMLVIGDSVESDVGMALAFGSPSVLVQKDNLLIRNGINESFHRIQSLADLPMLLNLRARCL